MNIGSNEHRVNRYITTIIYKVFMATIFLFKQSSWFNNYYIK